METKRHLARLGCILATALLSLHAVVATAADTITVETPWVRSAPPTAKVMAGYMVIHNHGPRAMTLKAAASPLFQRVEVHRTEIMQGMAHMKPVTELEIPSHASISFEPNSYHLMLIEPKHAFEQGDLISISLTFGDGTRVEFEAEVRDTPEAPDHHHHH